MSIIKTKIVATVGPASWDVPVLLRLAKAGVDVFRINFSHGTPEERQKILDNVRAVSRQMDEPLAVIGDLCGPKIRVGPITGGGVLLAEGSQVVIQREPVTGTADRISTTLRELVDDVQEGQRISMADGAIQLRVVDRRPDELVCEVLVGGVLGSGKGVNLPETDLALSALTEKDRQDVEWISTRDFDYVALSFVQRAQDVAELRALLREHGSEARIIAKIEKPQAMRNIEAIVEASDAILVARGDLGVEMALAEVPVAQKRLVRLCTEQHKPCIVATQMLETMTHSPTPTRAEVSDVANAVMDLADAVMLSGETAVGEYPVQTVRMMDDILSRTEAYLDETQAHDHALPTCAASDLEAVMSRAVHTIVHTGQIKAVVAFTASGATATMLSKMRLEVPILALTPNPRVRQQACLLYGTQAVEADTPKHTREVLAMASERILQLGWANKGDRIVVVSGRPLGQPGSTNTIVVHSV